MKTKILQVRKVPWNRIQAQRSPASKAHFLSHQHELSSADVPTRHFSKLTEYLPIYHRARQMAHGHKELVKMKIQNLLVSGITVLASLDWSFPFTITTKKDGNPRFYVDYRALNRVIKADRWLLSKIEEMFDELERSVVFSTLDLLYGYNQVRSDDSCNEMKLLVARCGTNQFEVMPFGLIIAPVTFQRMMDGILDNILFEGAYLDDVAIFSRSLPEYIGHLRGIFELISQQNLKLEFIL